MLFKRLQICHAKDLWVKQHHNAVQISDEPTLSLVSWDESNDDLNNIDASTVVMASPEIGMRDAIKLKQLSRYPILLVEDNQLVGILDDNEFYNALVGNFQNGAAHHQQGDQPSHHAA